MDSTLKALRTLAISYAVTGIVFTLIFIHTMTTLPGRDEQLLKKFVDANEIDLRDVPIKDFQSAAHQGLDTVTLSLKVPLADYKQFLTDAFFVGNKYHCLDQHIRLVGAQNDSIEVEIPLTESMRAAFTKFIIEKNKLKAEPDTLSPSF